MGILIQAYRDDCGLSDSDAEDDDRLGDDDGRRLDAILARVGAGTGAAAAATTANAGTNNATAAAAANNDFSTGNNNMAAAAAAATTMSAPGANDEDSVISLTDLLRPSPPATSTTAHHAHAAHSHDRSAHFSSAAGAAATDDDAASSSFDAYAHASWPGIRRSSSSALTDSKSILDRLQSLDVRQMMRQQANNDNGDDGDGVDGDGDDAEDADAEDADANYRAFNASDGNLLGGRAARVRADHVTSRIDGRSHNSNGWDSSWNNSGDNVLSAEAQNVLGLGYYRRRADLRRVSPTSLSAENDNGSSYGRAAHAPPPPSAAAPAHRHRAMRRISPPPLIVGGGGLGGPSHARYHPHRRVNYAAAAHNPRDAALGRRRSTEPPGGLTAAAAEAVAAWAEESEASELGMSGSADSLDLERAIVGGGGGRGVGVGVGVGVGRRHRGQAPAPTPTVGQRQPPAGRGEVPSIGARSAEGFNVAAGGGPGGLWGQQSTPHHRRHNRINLHDARADNPRDAALGRRRSTEPASRLASLADAVAAWAEEAEASAQLGMSESAVSLDLERAIGGGGSGSVGQGYRAPAPAPASVARQQQAGGMQSVRAESAGWNVAAGAVTGGPPRATTAATATRVVSSDRLQSLAVAATTAAASASASASAVPSSHSATALLSPASPSAVDRQVPPSLSTAGGSTGVGAGVSLESSLSTAAAAVAKSSSRPSANSTTNGGPTPLYHAVSSGAPYNVVRGLIESDPSSTGRQNGGGMTPLHCSIERYDTPIPVIKMLLAANPSTAVLRTRRGLTPLDLLWKRFIDPDPYRGEVAKSAADHLARLIEGAVSNDGCAMPPATVEGSSSEDGFDIYWEESRFSHREARRKANAMRALLSNPPLRDFWELMTYFVRAAQHGTVADPLPPPAADNQRGQQRWRVVHACVAVGCEPLLIRFAAALYPEQLSERDEHTGRLPLHIASALPDNCVERTVLRLFPLAARCHDGDGRLPLNLAIEAGKPWRLVRALFMTAPQTLTTRDVKTHMLPFMIAATEDNSSLDCIYRLLREDPLQVSRGVL